MNKIKFSKAILTIAFLAILTWGFSANTPIAKAATVEELLAQITALQTQIAQLQQQLAELQGKPAVWCHDFNANLRYGDRFGDVGYLQTALEKEGFKISEDEKMRNYFGDFTASAVVGFQEKYREDILAPWGLEHGTGFVGLTTRAKLNELYGCKIKTPVIISILPSKGVQGETVGVVIKGYNFTGVGDFSGCGISPVSDRGFELKSCKEVSDIQINAEFLIADDAVVGSRNITVQTPKGGKSNAITFIIISAERSITVIFPNGGERWVAGNTYDITWRYSGVDKVNIYLEETDVMCIIICAPGEVCAPCYAQQKIAADVSASLGRYSWTVPSNQTLKSTYRIRIADINYSTTRIYDDSDNNFSIVKRGGCIGEGEKGSIFNDDVCCSGLTKISNSWLSGSVCIAPTDGSFICSYCGNNVCGKGENVCNCSEDCKGKSITVISPNGGERWEIGKTYQIRVQCNFLTSIDLWLTDKYAEGGTVTKIASGLPCGPAGVMGPEVTLYNWTIPSFITPRENSFKVVAKTIDGKVADESDNYFSIVSPTTACTDSDGGNNIYVKGTAKGTNGEGTDCCAITTSENPRPSCTKFITGKDEGNSVWEYVCKENGEIIGYLYSCPSDYTCKEGACTKEEKSITIISPNGGEKWIEGNTYEITWKANGVEKVVIELIDYSCSSETPLIIATNILASQGSYSWKIPANLFESQANAYCPAYAYNPTTHYGWKSGDNFKIFIAELKTDGTYGVQDQSDNYFSIVEKEALSIKITSPKDGETVSGVVRLTARAEGVNKLGDMSLNLKANGTDFGRFVFSECMEGGGVGIPGGVPTYFKECWFDVDTSGLLGKTVYFGVEIIDVLGNKASDSINVYVRPKIYPYEIFPYDADVKTCTDSGGKVWPATGKDSAVWFVWNGCTHNKYYFVNPGQALKLHAYTDSCPGCVCYHPNFYLYEYENGKWVQKKYFDLPDVKGVTRDEYYTPSSGAIRIYAPNCFYLKVYSPEPIIVTACIDSDGSKDYYTKGKVFGLYGENKQKGIIFGDEEGNNAAAGTDLDMDWSIHYDYCLSALTSKILYEGYCGTDGAIYSEKYECPYGCKNGACVKEEKSITVISPNGGETWVVGNTYDIRWESRKIEKVRITLETTEPSVRVLPILIVDDYPANLGKYSWVVEDFPGRWKIKIIGKTADGRVVSDLSDNYFSIVSAIPTILYKTEWDGAKLTTTLLRSDDGGKTWKAIMSQYKGGITYATDSKNPKIIYAGDTGGNLMAEYLDIDLVKSTNGGDAWVDISKGVFYDVCQRIVCSQKIEGN